jgi:hypothetical protein
MGVPFRSLMLDATSVRLAHFIDQAVVPDDTFHGL